MVFVWGLSGRSQIDGVTASRNYICAKCGFRGPLVLVARERKNHVYWIQVDDWHNDGGALICPSCEHAQMVRKAQYEKVLKISSGPELSTALGALESDVRRHRGAPPPDSRVQNSPRPPMTTAPAPKVPVRVPRAPVAPKPAPVVTAPRPKTRKPMSMRGKIVYSLFWLVFIGAVVGGLVLGAHNTEVAKHNKQVERHKRKIDEYRQTERDYIDISRTIACATDANLGVRLTSALLSANSSESGDQLSELHQAFDAWHGDLSALLDRVDSGTPASDSDIATMTTDTRLIQAQLDSVASQLGITHTADWSLRNECLVR